MIDVFEKIKHLLVFESKDDFYYLQILQRKKENLEIGSNSRVIKNYYIGSVDYLEKRYDEIKTLCNQFNARAMLRLNKRSYSKVAFKTMQNIANSMANVNTFFGRLRDSGTTLFCGRFIVESVSKFAGESVLAVQVANAHSPILRSSFCHCETPSQRTSTLLGSVLDQQAPYT